MNVNDHALKSRRANVYLILAVGVLAASTAAPLIRAAIGGGAPVLVVATLRMTIASLLLTAPALIRSRSEYARLNRREVLLAVLSGVILGGHFAFWIGSIALTSVMSAVVLVSTVPLWVGLASPLLLKERNSLWTWGGIFVALAGTMLIGFKDVQQGAGLALRGDAFALAGAFFGAGYWIIGRRLRARLSLLAYIWLVYSSAALVLLALTGMQVLLTDLAVSDFPPMVFVWIVLLALLPQLIGHTAINHAVRYTSATAAVLATLGEPIGSTILAVIFFGEIPAALQIMGGVLILLGIAAGSRGETSEVTLEAAPASAGD